MDKLLAIINCSQVLTLAGPKRPRVGPELSDLGIIREGGVLLRNGLIEAVGSRQQIEKLVNSNCDVIDAGGRILLPGFVDAHTHPVFAGNRADEFEARALGATYQEIAEKGGGIQSTVNRTREASLSSLIETGKRYAQWFLRSGTTTIEAKSGYGLSVEDEEKILRAIKQLNADTDLTYVPTFLGAHTIPTEYKTRRNDYISLVIDEMIPRIARERLAEFCDVFCEDNVFSVDESWKILSAARCHGLQLRIHADQLSQSGGAALAAELGTVTADHLEHVSSEGISALAEAGVLPVLLPGSVYALGSSRYPPAREMIARGLPLVLATDFNPGSSPTPAMAMILSLASTHMKLSVAEAIIAATINAAYSLHRGDEIGSLEVGKRADVVVHDCGDYRELGYFFGLEPAWCVIAAGRKVFSRAQLVKKSG